MTLEEFRRSAETDDTPPASLSPELKSLWYTKAGRWDDAHEIAQNIPSKMGSAIHGLLHAIEGDFANSGYWYRQADRAPVAKEGIEDEWGRLVEANLK